MPGPASAVTAPIGPSDQPAAGMTHPRRFGTGRMLSLGRHQPTDLLTNGSAQEMRQHRSDRGHQRKKTRVVLVHEYVGGNTGMGRVVGAMARIAQDAGWNVTLVGVDVDNAFPWGHVIPVRYPQKLPTLVAGLSWAAKARLRLCAGDLSDAIVHVHAPILMPVADLFTCHHLAEGAARHGLRESVRSLIGLGRRSQEIVNVKVDSLLYHKRPSHTRVTFVSEFLRDEFTDLYGLPNGGEILPPPAPPWDPISAADRAAARRRYQIVGDQVAVGYFGGNDLRKGVTDVLELARDPRYIVLGAGPRSEKLRFGDRPGLGYVELRDVLAACDVVVAPTVFDAAPVAVLQAVAAGLPVVTGVNSGWAGSLGRFHAGVACAHDAPLGEMIKSAVPGSIDAAKAFTEHYSYEALRVRLVNLWDLVVADQTPFETTGSRRGRALRIRSGR